MTIIRYSHQIPLFLLMLLAASCNTQDFEKTKSGTTKINAIEGSTEVRIKFYRLTYNPKARGFVRLSLDNGSEYEAKSVEGGSFASISALLKESNVLFETARQEVVINKFIHQ